MTSYIDYIEVYLKFNDNVSISKEQFDIVFEYLKRKPSKHLSNYFQKTVYKEYHKELVFQQIYDSYSDFKDNKTPSKENIVMLVHNDMNDIRDDNLIKLFNNNADRVVVLLYKKNIFPLSSFPSTTKKYESSLEQRITFKINNRIYLNLSRTQYTSDQNKMYYNVNINYQFNKHNDVLFDVQCINDIVDLITTFE